MEARRALGFFRDVTDERDGALLPGPGSAGPEGSSDGPDLGYESVGNEWRTRGEGNEWRTRGEGNEWRT